MLDAGGVASPVRRLLGRRASQNVVAWRETEAPGALVLVAHVDAGRSGLVFRRGPRAAWPARPRRGWSARSAAAGTDRPARVLRSAGRRPRGTALSAIQLVPPSLMVAVALLLDIALSLTVAGANDNASGAALALQMIERLDGRLEHFELQLVLSEATRPVRRACALSCTGIAASCRPSEPFPCASTRWAREPCTPAARVRFLSCGRTMRW